MVESMYENLYYRLDPVSFATDKLGIVPDPWQAEVMSSQSKRILLNCSRQTGKSTTSAIIALHQALYHPDSLVLLVSPALRQSQELFKKVQFFLKKVNLGSKLQEDNKLSMQLDNGSRIVSLPAAEGTIRGFSSVSLIIEDEASRVSDDLYRATKPMLAVSNGRHMIMSTPYGKRGHFFEEWFGENDWTRIEIPATACTRISPDFLEAERRSLGEWWYKQEYCCQFMDTVDSLFSYDTIISAMDPTIEPLFPVANSTHYERGSFASDEVNPLVIL